MPHNGDNCPPKSIGDNCRLSKKDGDSYESPMPRTFREALIAATTKPGLSVREVAEWAGVSYEQLKKVVQREGASTNVEDARKIAPDGPRPRFGGAFCCPNLPDLSDMGDFCPFFD